MESFQDMLAAPKWLLIKYKSRESGASVWMDLSNDVVYRWCKGRDFMYFMKQRLRVRVRGSMSMR